MPRPDVARTVIEADVLAVGAGFAGLWAAIHTGIVAFPYER